MKNLLFTGLILAFIIAGCSPKNYRGKTGSDGRLRVMSYNVHHCNPPSKDSLIDMEVIARVIQNQHPDLVALQEVDVKTNRSGLKNEARIIAHKTGMHYAFFKSIDYDGGEYGLAILSKFPMTEEKKYRLPTEVSTNGEPRIMATVKVKLGTGRYLRFGNLHFDAQKANLNRNLQIREVGRLVMADSIPVILAGDFNSIENSEVIHHLDSFMTRTCSSCPPTIPVKKPKNAIDFIAFKPGKAFSIILHKVVNEQYASDHLPIVAELKMNR